MSEADARAVVEAVLARLGEAAAAVRVYDVAPVPLVYGRPELGDSSALMITMKTGSGRCGVYFDPDIDREQQVAATAEHVQDHVIEMTGGAAVPECPGHVHPMQPRVVDGVASWVCPKSDDHHREPILE